MDRRHGFLLGPWEVRPLTGEISGAAGTVHLEPKVMDVLLVLAERPREVVEREDLLQRIWGTRAAVSDEPLTRCIAELRRALGDSRQEPVYIQTIPKRGYRLLSAVTPLGAAEASTVAAHASVKRELVARDAVAVPAPSMPTAGPSRLPLPAATAEAHRRTPRLAWAGAFALLAATALGLALLHRANRAAPETVGESSIAVLPFVDVGDSADGAYFGEGLADEILSRLSAVRGLRVVARTSSFSFAGSHADVREIGERLGVAHVLEGTVRHAGDRVRISARLVDARRGYEIWAANFEGVLDDIFALQDQIANAIVAKLPNNAATIASEGPIATRAPTRNLAAYELLLRGRVYLNRRDEEDLRRSVRLFRQAIELDPSYGYAYVELAKAYALLPSYSAEVEDEMFDLALATLAEGRATDPTIDAPMQSVLALISYARWDWIAAEIAFRRALEQSENDPDLLVWYSQFLAAVGRPAEAAEYARRAKEIDLLSPVVNHRLSVALMWIDEDAEALRYSGIAAELGMGSLASPDAYIVLKLRLRDYEAVRPLLIGVQTMFARSTAWVDPLLEALASPDRTPAAIEALARAEQARDIPRKYLFGAWTYLGESERAVKTGLELVNDRTSFNVEFVFSREARALRANSRFGEILRAVGLVRYWDQFGWPDVCARRGEQIVCH